ncbi:alpha/beta-hydrolase [Serendipita vermifera]|nr:alpha/beta-hydrolase [Serendipita vermifera]
MSKRGSVASISSNASKQLRNPPLIRWLSGSSTANVPYHHRAPSDSRLLPASSSKAELTKERRSEDLPASDTHISEEEASAALKQAISDEVFKIRKPPEARMATHPEGRPFRHPVLLDNLARASMPTSSLTKPLTMTSSPLSIQPKIIASPTSYTRPVQGVTRTDARSSIDSLRSLTARDRGIQTSTSTGMPPIMSNVNRWWFQDGNKETVDELLGDEDKAPTAQQEAEGIRKKYLTPKNPVVFCHGLMGFDSVSLGASFAPLQITHWRGIKEVLEENGIEVLITKVPATSGVEERAKVLGEKIAEVYPGRAVHLIGHSMGGLDCRFLAASRPTAFKILSVTTIATPHRGSCFAEYFLETLGKARIPSLVSFLEYLPNGGGDGKAFEGLTRDAMRKFNEEVKDVEGIEYFSWGASFLPSLVDAFKWPHSVILEKEGPNDGLVSVSSAQWGKYLGTLEDVNHLDLVGWINMARYKWAELTGKSIKFKPASFYLEMAARLAEEVEGLKRDDESDGKPEVLFSSSDDEEETAGHDRKGKSTHRRPSKHSGAKPELSSTPPGTVGGGVD